MVSKVTLAACVVALCAQLGTAQLGCGCNAGLGLGVPSNGLGLAGNGQAVCGNAAYVGSGGGLSVTSYSPIAPSGISILSENAIEGPLCASGALPVLSGVGLEGQLSTAGQTGVQYSCGSGNVGITSENGAGLSGGNLGYAGLAGAGIGRAGGLGYGAGLARGVGGSGCGI